MLNFYKMLNVCPNASIDEIKGKYKSLILQNHPDKLLDSSTEDSDALTRLLNTIWKTLSDSERRLEYDRQLNQSDLRQNYIIGDVIPASELDSNISSCDGLEISCRCGNLCLLIGQYETEKVCLFGCNFCSQVIIVDETR